MKKRKTISVVLPTYNAENSIEKCVKSLAWVDEIIVVDMMSTDQTPEICKKYKNVKVLERKDYIFGNVNYGIEKADSDWILRFDSDEVMCDDLKQEILEVLENDGFGYDGFYCKSKLFMFGKEIKFGVGMYTYRKQLFKKGFALYEVKSEHEEMFSKGRWGCLKNAYLHYNCATAQEFMKKVKYYVGKDMERYKPQESIGVFETLKKGIKFFALYYFKWVGYKDGLAGLKASFLRGPYYVWVEDKAKKEFNKNK